MIGELCPLQLPSAQSAYITDPRLTFFKDRPMFYGEQPVEKRMEAQIPVTRLCQQSK